MSTTTPARPHQTSVTRRRRRWARHWPALAIGAMAFLGRLIPVLNGAGMFGRHTYDPFVYYGAAVALSTGHLPYRDFLFLHPTGILLVLQPFAALGGVVGDPLGMACARLAWMGLGAISSALIFVILRGRGLAAAVVGAALYAVWFPAVYVERDVRLEALGTVLVLAALLAIERLQSRGHAVRWAALVGVLAGFGAVVKLWGLVPLAVLVVWLLVCHGVRAAATTLGTAAATIAVVLGPFALAAPNWLQLIVFDQLGRPRDGHDWPLRLRAMLGLAPVPAGLAVPALLVGCVLTLAAVVLAARTATGRLHATLAIAGGVLLLAGPTWYPHYPALIAGPLCLLYGQAAGVVLRHLRWPVLRRVAVASAVAGLLAAQALLFTQSVGWRFPGAALASALAPRPGCVTTDRTAALVLTNTLRRNIARGCPIVVDILGYKFAGQSRDGSPAETRRRFQHLLVEYLGTGRSVILVHERPHDFEPKLRERIEAWPVVAASGRYQVRQPV